MNTQMLSKAPQAASKGPHEPAPAGERREADKGEETAFGVALQVEVAKQPSAKRALAGSTKAPVGKGQWAATAALAKKSKAIGRTLRGISELAIGRARDHAPGPALKELNAAGREFAGKAAQVAQTTDAEAEIGQVRAAVTAQISEALSRSDGERGVRLRKAEGKATAAAAAAAGQPAERTSPAQARRTEAAQAQDDASPKPADVGTKTAEQASAAKPRTPERGPKITFDRSDRPSGVRGQAEVTALQDQAVRVDSHARVLGATGSDAAARVARMTEQMALMVRDGTHRAQMELHPPDLGRVTLELEVRGEQVAVRMVVESAEAHQRLRSDAEALAEALKGQGLDLTGMDVSVDRGDSGEDGRQDQAGGRGAADGAFGSLMGEGPPQDATRQATARSMHDGEVDVQA